MGAWYRTGTVAVTNGNANIVGTSTLWLTQAAVGDIFVGPDGVQYEITSITDDTHMAIKQLGGTAAYAGTTLSAQVYAIIRNFTSTLPAQLASQLAAMMTSWHDTTDDLANWLGGTGSVVIHDAAGVAHTVKTPAALEGAVSGRLSKSVAGAADVTLNTTEASNLILDFTGVLTGNINVIVPASARTFFVYNNTTGTYTLTVKTAAGTGVAVAQGGRAIVECDATNVVQAESAIPGVLSVAGLLTANAGIAIPTGQSITGAGTAAISGFKSGSFGTAGNQGSVLLLGSTSGTATLSTDATVTKVTLDKPFDLGSNSMTAGAINGTTGAFSDNGATALVVGTGAATAIPLLVLNGGTNSGAGTYIKMERGGSTANNAYIGYESAINGGTSNDLTLFAGIGNAVNLYANNALVAKASSACLAVTGALSATVAISANSPTAQGQVGGKINGERKDSIGAYAAASFGTSQATTSSTVVEFYNPNGAVGGVATNASATLFNTASDQRLKLDLGIATDTTVLENTVIHDFKWRVDQRQDRGVFAQEAYLVNPSAISKGDDDPTNITERWGADYSKYVPDLIVGWQNHESRLKALEAKLP